ncbi:MAG: hypothetical protein CMQ46_10045 [Gammaproteobacteria bacterium]|nr:hypothetical protein [Gammaproteobacteria bacterium]MBJ55588.1 hypothetical protein [Gammaproteobacteria bacterium]|tara:strand:+ start:81 stop:1289 length:1209 start_codon:yes stop_codon:yes gene_type:complete
MRNCLNALVLLTTLAPLSSIYAQSLVEEEVIEHALSESSLRDLTNLSRQAALLAAEAAVPPANPELEYSRETLDGPVTDTEESFVWIRQRLDLAGVNSRLRDAAALDAAARMAELDLIQGDRIATIRRHLYRHLSAKERLDHLTDSMENMSQLIDSASMRVAAGDLSEYDLIWLQREYDDIQLKITEAAATLNSEAATLISLAQLEPEASFDGDVLPPDPAAMSSSELLNNQPDLQLVERQFEAAQKRQEAASRQRWPSLTVGLGERRANEGAFRSEGNLFSLTVEVPLFGTGKRNLAAAQAHASSLAAERAMVNREVSAEIARLQAVVDNQRTIAVRQYQRSQKQQLAELARAAYLAGEVSVNQLLDAERSDLELRLGAADAALEARETFIEWQTLTGALP